MYLFEDLSMLEPKCPGCSNIIKLDLTTRFSEQKHAHVCLKCGFVLK